MPKLPVSVRWFALAGLVVFLDQLSKSLILKNLMMGDSVPVTAFFNLVLVFNRGAAFSFLAAESGWQRWLFTLLAIAVVAYIGWTLLDRAINAVLAVGWALIMGGAIGNVIDRLTQIGVVDFLDFHWSGVHFWAFNVADSAISLGVALLLWHQWQLSKIKEGTND